MTAIGRIIAFKRPLALACSVLLTVTSGGCGPQFNFVGTWTGHQNVTAKPGADPDIVSSYAKVELVIEDGKKFRLQLDSMPFAGSVSVSGTKALLTAETVLNTTIDRLPPEQRITAQLTPNPDGTLLFVVGTRDPVVLRRQSK